MTKKTNEIIEVEIPVAEAADMMSKAAAAGLSLSYYVGSLAVQAAYGALHPRVIEFRNRAKAGISGPKTQEGN